MFPSIEEGIGPMELLHVSFLLIIIVLSIILAFVARNEEITWRKRWIF